MPDKDDYNLDWTNISVLEDSTLFDIIRDEHIDEIQQNIDLIKDNLANVDHDVTVFLDNDDDYNSALKSGVEVDRNVNVQTTYNNDHDVTKYIVDLTDHDNYADISYCTSENTTHDFGVDNSKHITVRTSEEVKHDFSEDESHYSIHYKDRNQEQNSWVGRREYMKICKYESSIL